MKTNGETKMFKKKEGVQSGQKMEVGFLKLDFPMFGLSIC